MAMSEQEREQEQERMEREVAKIMMAQEERIRELEQEKRIRELEEAVRAVLAAPRTIMTDYGSRELAEEFEDALARLQAAMDRPKREREQRKAAQREQREAAERNAAMWAAVDAFRAGQQECHS